MVRLLLHKDCSKLFFLGGHLQLQHACHQAYVGSYIHTVVFKL
jgi:hypothetical protein